MAVNTYKKGTKDRLSANFRSSEFDCKGKSCCATTLIDPALVKYLQSIRDHFGAAVVIESGYRCKTHNAKISNAAAKSKHLEGMAADIKVKGVAPAEVAKYAEGLGVKGIGLYDTDKDGHFVHIDTRSQKAFWQGQSQKKCETFLPKAAAHITLQTLQKGDKGPQVKALQSLLGIKADGIFGSDTQAAVKKLQTSAKLTDTGICDESTWAKLLAGEVRHD